MAVQNLSSNDVFLRQQTKPVVCKRTPFLKKELVIRARFEIGVGTVSSSPGWLAIKKLFGERESKASVEISGNENYSRWRFFLFVGAK